MAEKRKTISKKTRFEVFKRDGFVCQYCGAHPPAVILEPDHINPVCNGGGNGIDNLVTSCFDCNRGKAGNLLTAVPKSLKDRADEIKEREAQIAGYREIMQASLDRIEDDMWQACNGTRQKYQARIL
jgi:5-methylcytosine-specific restriction endonuclease McrA